jgi:hypothetical protein
MRAPWAAIDAVQVQPLEVETHCQELMNGSWSEPITASFLARVPLLLDEVDVKSIASKPVCGGCSSGTATDDQY